MASIKEKLQNLPVSVYSAPTMSGPWLYIMEPDLCCIVIIL